MKSRYTVYALDIETFNVLGEEFETDDLNLAIETAKAMLEDHKNDTNDNYESGYVITVIDDNLKEMQLDWQMMAFGYMSEEELSEVADQKFNNYTQIIGSDL